MKTGTKTKPRTPTENATMFAPAVTATNCLPSIE